MNPYDIQSKILDQVKKNGPCTLDGLVDSLPGLSWNQVFAGVDRLSRDGYLTLRQQSRFVYVVSAEPAGAPRSMSAV